jgi:hypothetical protein
MRRRLDYGGQNGPEGWIDAKELGRIYRNLMTITNMVQVNTLSIFGIFG